MRDRGDAPDNDKGNPRIIQAREQVEFPCHRSLCPLGACPQRIASTGNTARGAAQRLTKGCTRSVLDQLHPKDRSGGSRGPLRAGDWSLIASSVLYRMQTEKDFMPT